MHAFGGLIRTFVCEYMQLIALFVLLPEKYMTCIWSGGLICAYVQKHKHVVT